MGPSNSRNISRRRFIEASALTAGGALLAACAPQSAAPTTAPAPTTAAAPTQAPATVKAGPKGKVIYGNAEPPTSAQWDDLTVYGLVDFQAASLVQDRLWEMDEKGKLMPRLATAWKYIDDKTLEIALRQGVKYHDGAGFTAADVKATLDHVSKDTAVAHNLFWAPVETKIMDDYKIQISSDPPFGPLVPVLACTSMQPKEWVGKQDKWNAGDNGCGPYRFVEYKNNKVTLEANEAYWDGAPGIKTVEFEYIEDWNARTNALLAGDVDIITRCSSEQLDAVKGNAKYYTVENSPAISVSYIYANEQKAPMNNKKFRQAIFYAIDRKTILDKLMLGVGKYADNIIPTSSLFYEPMKEKYAFSPDKAKQLLAESGLSSSELKLTMATSTLVPHQKEIDLAVVQWLKDVGIQVEVSALEVGQFRTDWPQYDITLNTNGTPNVDPDFLFSWYVSDPTFGAGIDKANGGDDAVALNKKQRSEPDPAKRQKAVTELCTWLWDYQPDGVISDELWPFIINARVKQFRRNRTFGEMLVRYASVEG